MIFTVCYALGRAIGTGASEFLTVLWPAQFVDAMRERDYGPTTTVARQAAVEGPTDTQSDDLDWLGWATPAIQEVLAEHMFTHGDRFEDKGECMCGETPWDWTEYVDHVAPIIAERTACDPARAITALWNHQLKQGMP